MAEILLSGQLRHGDRTLSFYSTLLTFGTATNPAFTDLTLDLVFLDAPDTAAFIRDFATKKAPHHEWRGASHNSR